ncbi:hypothetical protein R5R35_011161 [Gryllus longicercus]|uniref:Selenoprotein M n=1 Tax=Gryllus longicercus TaxID=2509291 RepID=A0AAN9Z6Q9_9ORTH
MNCICFRIFTLLAICFGYSEGERIARASIESCTGCALANYPEIKKFIEFDIHDFEDVAFKQVPGLLPELVLYDKYDQELERHPFRCRSREECCQLLLEKGFKRKAKALSGSHLHDDM